MVLSFCSRLNPGRERGRRGAGLSSETPKSELLLEPEVGLELLAVDEPEDERAALS